MKTSCLFIFLTSKIIFLYRPVLVEVSLLSPVWLLYNPMDYNLAGYSVHGITQQEYWSGLPFAIPQEIPNPGI